MALYMYFNHRKITIRNFNNSHITESHSVCTHRYSTKTILMLRRVRENTRRYCANLGRIQDTLCSSYEVS